MLSNAIIRETQNSSPIPPHNYLCVKVLKSYDPDMWQEADEKEIQLLLEMQKSVTVLQAYT